MYHSFFSPSHLAILKYFFTFLFIKTLILETETACKLASPSPIEENLLEKLKPLNGHTFETKDTDNPSNYSYKVSICDKMKDEADGIGAVQYASNSSKYILGKYDSVEIMGGTNWMLLKYYEGSEYHNHCNKSERETHIMIICDPNTLLGKLEILEERNSSVMSCFYLFELGSNVSCTFKPTIPEGFSSGSVFCILFFTFAILYLTLGFLYKRLVVGAKGLEQIPNYGFWKDFGNLQADGCDYICRCGSRQESQAYRGIDEHLNVEEERDDSLLNM